MAQPDLCTAQGYRYELWCVARAAGTTYCMVGHLRTCTPGTHALCTTSHQHAPCMCMARHGQPCPRTRLHVHACRCMWTPRMMCVHHGMQQGLLQGRRPTQSTCGYGNRWGPDGDSFNSHMGSGEEAHSQHMWVGVREVGANANPDMCEWCVAVEKEDSRNSNQTLSQPIKHWLVRGAHSNRQARSLALPSPNCTVTRTLQLGSSGRTLVTAGMRLYSPFDQQVGNGLHWLG